MELFEILSPFSWDGLIIVVVVCLLMVFAACTLLFSIVGFIYMLFGDLIEREVQKK